MVAEVICIGAGLAGLTAAYLLSKQGVPVTVLEKDPVYVGGISKTVSYKGFCFEGDGLWNSNDADLIKLATGELVKLGLAKETDIKEGYVVRQQKAY